MKIVPIRFKVVIAVLGIFAFACSTGHASESVNFMQQFSSGMISPVDVAVSNEGEMYVLDEKTAQVSVFDTDGNLKLSFGEKGVEAGALREPQTIALTSEGHAVVADTGNNRVQVFSAHGEFLYQLGNEGMGAGQFREPTHVSVDQLGNIHVLDERLLKIAKFSPHGVFLSEVFVDERATDMVFDLQNNMYLLFQNSGKIVKYLSDGNEEVVSVKPDKDGYSPLIGVVAMDVDVRGDILMMERKDHKVMKIDQNGNVLFSFGSQGAGRGQFQAPRNITVVNNHLLVADAANSRIQVLKVEGSQKASLKKIDQALPVLDYASSIYTGKWIVDIKFIRDRGLYSLSDYNGKILIKEEEQALKVQSDENVADLKNPKAIYVYNNGQMIVTDTGHNRIQFLNEDGSVEYAFGRKGKNSSEFSSPQGVAVSSKGEIFIADTKNNRIQVFNKDGIYLRSFGKMTEFIDDYGAERGTLFWPKDLDFDSKDRLYVLDYKNKRIQIFDTNGKVLDVIDSVIEGLEFAQPVDFTLDEYDYLYIADRGTHQVHIIDPKGKYLMGFGSAGKGPSYFPQLTSIESHDGHIYVSDYQLEDIQVFSFKPSLDQKQERVFITKVFPLIPLKGASDAIRLKMTQKMAFQKASEELAKELDLPLGNVDHIIKLEKEEVLSDGHVSITISLPKWTKSNQVDLISRK